MKQVMTMKREYARPEMRVVELKHKCCILAGSDEPKPAQRQDYESEEWY